MKHLKHLLAALVFVSLIVFTSCGGGKGGDDPDPATQQAEKLVASWTLVPNKAKFGTEVRDTWNGFTLSITGDKDGGNFTTTNVPADPADNAVVWPSSGSWEFDPDNVGIVVRDNDVEMNVTVTSTSLILGFNISTSARGSSVNGDWTFEFTTN